MIFGAQLVARSRLTMPELELRTESLHDEERELLRSLGESLLLGGSDVRARRRLREIREELEAAYAALRLLEAATSVTLEGSPSR